MRHLTFILAIGLCACVTKPQQEYRIDQVPTINSINELMRVQAQILNPMLEVRDKKSLNAVQLKDFAQRGAFLVATSGSLTERFAKSYAGNFLKNSEKLNAAANELQNNAQAKKVEETKDAINAVRAACAGCHQEYGLWYSRY